MKKLFRLAILLTLALNIGGLIISVGASPALAAPKIKQIDFQPQVSIPDSIFNNTESVPSATYDPGTKKTYSDLLAKYIKAFYDYGLAIAGILAAIVLMAGGVLWLTSGGNDSKITQAKELIFGSIIGALILFGSWIILNTINPELLKLRVIDIEGVSSTDNTCCQRDTLHGEKGVSRQDCEGNDGTYFPRAELITNTGGYSFCADTGCCRCKIGGNIVTLFISNSTCLDEKSGAGKVLPETCETACKGAADAMVPGVTPTFIRPGWEILYSWGQVCNNGECAWSSGQSGPVGSW